MAEAVRDGNHVTSALGVSSANPALTLNMLVDPATGRLLVQSGVSSGTADPTGAPQFVGQVYVNTSNGGILMANGTDSVANWVLIS